MNLKLEINVTKRSIVKYAAVVGASFTVGRLSAIGRSRRVVKRKLSEIGLEIMANDDEHQDVVLDLLKRVKKAV